MQPVQSSQETVPPNWLVWEMTRFLLCQKLALKRDGLLDGNLPTASGDGEWTGILTKGTTSIGGIRQEVPNERTGFMERSKSPTVRGTTTSTS